MTESRSGGVEVADADLARQPRLASLDEGAPDVLVRRAVAGPVDQPQVDVVGAEHLEAPAQRLQRLAGPVGWELGGEEDVVARHSAVRQRATDLSLVAVHRGGVEVPVAGLEGGRGGADGVVALDLPGAEAEQRHRGTLAERGGVVGELGGVVGHGPMLGTQPLVRLTRADG